MPKEHPGELPVQHRIYQEDDPPVSREDEESRIRQMYDPDAKKISMGEKKDLIAKRKEKKKAAQVRAKMKGYLAKSAKDYEEDRARRILNQRLEGK